MNLSAKIIANNPVTATIRHLMIQPYTPLNFRPGQFVMFFATINGQTIDRPYSIANAPSPSSEGEVPQPRLVGQSPACLEFVIRLEPHGKMSEYIANLKVNDSLTIKGPFGRFGTCHVENPTELIFIAGGVGIAPIRSMIQHQVAIRTEERKDGRTDERMNKKTNPNSRLQATSYKLPTSPPSASSLQPSATTLSLYYAFRNQQEYLFRQEFESLANTGHLSNLITSISDPDPTWSGNTGFITDHLRSHLKQSSTQAIFICGPPPMVDSVKTVLSSLGYSRNQIHLEAW